MEDRTLRKETGLRLFLVVLGMANLAPLSGVAAMKNPVCSDSLRKERAAILEKFGKLQNYKTYTPEKARVLQARVEKYLLAIGNVLENFNLDDFFREELRKIPHVRDLPKTEQARLIEALRPSFEQRRLPTLATLESRLRSVGLANLPAKKIRETMDDSFQIWKTKIVFDESGKSTYNRLAKAFTENQDLGEFSIDLGLLGKNEWDAFFEAEKGKGIFNPSMPGAMRDIFTSTEAHEAVHMIVETLAAKGHDSPYSVWVKMDPKYKPNGAIGARQKRALAAAVDPLSDGDYYRTELYLDELPAHIIQSAFLNVELSKNLRTRFQSEIESVTRPNIREELEEVYGEYLRLNPVDWRGYSGETKKIFTHFLETKASDQRTKVSKLLTEMTEYLNWVDLINDGGSSAVYEARKMIDDAISRAEASGLKSIHPKPGDPIQIKPDVFLGKKGYLIEVHIPIEVLQKEKNFVKIPEGAVVKFRFTSDGALTQSITPGKLKKLIARTDWVAELSEKARKEVEAYSEFLDSNGALKDYTFEDVFRIKRIHTRLRQLTRETQEQIRASR